MAFAQSKGGQANLSNGGDQSTYHHHPPHLDLHSGGPLHNSYVRDQSSSRGRGPGATPSLTVQPQSALSGRALSPRTGANTGEINSRPGTATSERRRSGSYGHHRQTSIVQGIPQHSRNNSIAKSPATRHRNPSIASSLYNGGSIDGISNGSVTQVDLYDFRSPNQSFSAGAGSSHSFATTQSLAAASAQLSEREMVGSENDVTNGQSTTSPQRIDRVPTTKSRRDHGGSQSKQAEQRPSERSVAEYSLHHLFYSWSARADFIIQQCIASIPGTGIQVEEICGPGADKDFDALISAMGHITRQKPKRLVDAIMYWRKSKSEELQAAQLQMSQAKGAGLAARTLQRRNTEQGQPSATAEGQPLATNSELYEIVVQAERKVSLSIYLICRVIVEVYQQSTIECITPSMDDKLEDLIFDQLQRLDPERVQASPFHYANWNIYGQLLGVMSSLNFPNISRRFLQALQLMQEDSGSKAATPRESEKHIELLVRAMGHLSVGTQTDTQWKDSCEFMCSLGKMFVSSHGQPIKHAYCQVLELLVYPVAASPNVQFSSPKWKTFLNTLNGRLNQMLVKPRHWPEAYPLSTLLLCASPPEFFTNQWIASINGLQAKFKDRATRSCALQSVCRLTWTYLERSPDSSATIRKLEDVIKIMLPSGKKTHLSTDPAIAEPIIEFSRIVGFRFPDLCFKAIIFPLINSDLFTSGKEIKVEQLEPERIVVGIRAFLAVIGDLENREQGGPKFPSFNIRAQKLPVDQNASPYQRSLAEKHSKPYVEQKDHRLSKAVQVSRLDETSRECYARFCEVLKRITLICDSTFGGQAALDEKLGVITPKTPITESFSFGRREDPSASDPRQGYYELLHVAVQALPRCLSTQIPFNALINLLCTGTAHVQYHIAEASVESLRAIARQSHAQLVTIGFARFIFNFDIRYSTMSDEGLLGPGHIQSTLQLYLDLLKIWIEEIKQKTRNIPPTSPDDIQSINRGLQLDLTNTSALVEEVESHGLFFLCSQSLTVRAHAINVLRLVTEFDAALGRDHPRIIQILEGDILKVISPEDDRLTVMERSRLQKSKRKTVSQNTLIELCSSDVSYDSTLWFKVFPNLVRLSFEQCQMAVMLGRDIVCARLEQMHTAITAIAEGMRGPQGAAYERVVGKTGLSTPEVIVEQWKLYLVMACTTLTNAGAQTQSQLQHGRNRSRLPGHGNDRISSARSLFSFIIPLLQASPESIREAIVTALGSININLYRTLLESLQYAVTTFNEEAKARVNAHQRTGSSPRRDRAIDRLRTEVTHVYKLTSRFLHEAEVLRDEWIIANLIKYTDDMRIFLSDAEIQGDWEFQPLRRYYCGLLEEVFEGINRTQDPARWMSFEARKAAFGLMEDWCGYSPNQNHTTLREDGTKQSALNDNQDAREKPNVTADIHAQRRNLRISASSAMASLCGGPVSVITDGGRGAALSFDVHRIMSWIKQLFEGLSDKEHATGQRALKNLIKHNKTYPKLLEHAIDQCFIADKPKTLESYFEVVSAVLLEHEDYQIPFWRVLGVILFTLGNEKTIVRTKSIRLLHALTQRQQRGSKLQDFDISITDKTTAVYKKAQFEISKRLAKQYSELVFYLFSQFAQHYKAIHRDQLRSMISWILPWVQVIELQLAPNGGPASQTYMVLANMLEITTRSNITFHNEVQALWKALASGPHGGNVQVVLDFVISLCIERREQSFVDYAKQIVVFLSDTQAGQKLVDFLLLQINPRSMVHTEKKPMDIPPDYLGLPYVADLGEALPIGNKQTGYSLGQLSLILLVDLMVAPMRLSADQVPVLLQVCLVLWDHYTPLVQEQAREMLVHLIHELVISQIEDDSTNPSKETIEDLVEAIRESKPNVVWSYKDDEEEANRVLPSLNYVANEVINLFSLAYPNIHERWAKTTLNWATCCSVRHLACRSFQIFRAILSALDHPMLADMLARLSNTIADEASDVQNFAMEILTTLKTIIGALEPADQLKYPQLFWVTCACLNTVNEREFIDTLDLLDLLLSKVDLSDPAVVRLLMEAKPDRWSGTFEGIMPLVYKGLKSINSLPKTLAIIKKTAPLPESYLIGDQSRVLFGVFANLPSYMHCLETIRNDDELFESASIMASAAETEGYGELAMVLNGFITGIYSTKKDFLVSIMATIGESFFPALEVKSVIFLMGLLSNKLSWYKVNTMDILCVLMPDIDMRQPEISRLGPDLISPLLRLLQTEHCPQALEVMDCIMPVNASVKMEREHLRMSMIMPGAKSGRKEFEKSWSLYGIPDETGWSIPAPALQSNSTRSNVHVVFYTCAKTNPAEPEPAATPEIEFDREEYNHGSYFPTDRTDGHTDDRSIDHIDDRKSWGFGTIDVYDLSHLDDTRNLGERVDALDELFDDLSDEEDNTQNKYQSGLSDVTVVAFKPDQDHGANLYDQQTAPILDRSLSRSTSINSLQNPYAEQRPQVIMNPAAFSLNFPHAPATTQHPNARPFIHSRSVTSPSNHTPHQDSDLMSDPETGEDGMFSDDERSTGGHNGPPTFEAVVRRTRSMKKIGQASDGKEYRQGELLRGQARIRSKSQAPGSPEVPKVPEAFLMGTMKSPDL